MAPRLAVASIAATDSGRLGRYPATRSPFFTPSGGERLREARHEVVELPARQLALDAVLAPEGDGERGVALAQQVLGEIELSFRKPGGARHPIGIDQAPQPGLAAHLAETPHQLPEIFGMLHGPAVQLCVVALAGEAHEARHAGARGGLRARRPERLFGHVSRGAGPLPASTLGAFPAPPHPPVAHNAVSCMLRPLHVRGACESPPGCAATSASSCR